MSSGVAHRAEGSPVSLTVPEGMVDAVAEIWRKGDFDDASLHDRGRQADLVDHCAARLGAVWDRLTSDLRAGLRTWPHWVVLRGAGQRATPPLLAAIGVSIGTLLDPYGQPWSRILQEIAARQEWAPDIEWHTDSTGWPVPNAYTALSCVRRAPRGGGTDLLSLSSVREALAGADADVISVLGTARFAWPLDNDLADSADRATVQDMVLAADRIRFMRDALLRSGSAQVQAAARRLIDVTDSLPPDATALLQPGDILVFDNRRTLHRRGTTHDPRLRRLLVRVKIR